MLGLKIKKVFLALCVYFLCLESSLYAQPVRGGSPRATGGAFGLGFLLGEPLGFSAKYFYAGSKAIEFSTGYGYSHFDGFQMSLDHLWHPHVLTDSSDFKLSWFLGVGPYVILGDDSHRNHSHSIELGPRFPFGITFNLKSFPIDIAAILAPGANLASHPGFRMDGGIAIRYYF